MLAQEPTSKCDYKTRLYTELGYKITTNETAGEMNKSMITKQEFTKDKNVTELPIFQVFLVH